MMQFLTRPWLIKVWSGKTLRDLSAVRVFTREAREVIHTKHPGVGVAYISFERFGGWPVVVIDIKYRLKGETKERFVRSSALGRSFRRRASNAPVN